MVTPIINKTTPYTNVELAALTTVPSLALRLMLSRLIRKVELLQLLRLQLKAHRMRSMKNPKKKISLMRLRLLRINLRPRNARWCLKTTNRMKIIRKMMPEHKNRRPPQSLSKSKTLSEMTAAITINKRKNRKPMTKTRRKRTSPKPT